MATAWFWFHRGQWYEQVQWITELLPHRYQLNAELRIAILLNLWIVAHVSEEFPPSGRWTDEVMQLLEICPHPLIHATAWHFTGYYSYNDLPKGIAAWERSIAFARAAYESPLLRTELGILTDRDFCLAFPLWAYGDRLVEYGKFGQAMPLLRESLAIFQARGSHYAINSLGTLGRMALLQGDLLQGYKFLSEAVALSTKLNYQYMMGHFQGFLGLATLYQGKIAEARQILNKNHILCTELKDKGFVARNAIYLAATYLWEGLLDEAEQWLNRSYAHYANPHRVRIDVVERLSVAACLAAGQQQYGRAATIFGLAEQIRSRLDYALPEPLRRMADAALATVREALTTEVFAKAFAAGQQMILEEAFATILLPSEVEKSIG